jgi:CSLREA domain-containing protein
VALAAALGGLALPASALATTYTVTKTSDSDDGSCTAALCSLRDAILYSAGEDKVVVPASTTAYAVTIGALPVGHDLTIAGAGAGATTVQANGTTFGVFAVAGGQNVTMSGLTVTGGKLVGLTAKGAGINTSGNLTLTGVTVTQNKVESTTGGAPEGAGIEVAAGNLTLDHSQVTNNTATSDATGGAPAGAGIDDSAGELVTVSNSQITGNVASTTGSTGTPTPTGGGIRDASPGTLAISSSQVSHDSATTNGGGGAAYGGGIEIDGGGVVTISGSTISADAATAPDATSEGGGIANRLGNLTVASTTVDDNTAEGGTAAEGGGIASGGPFSLSASTVNGNTAAATGSANSAGGGLALTESSSIVNSTIAENTAGAGTGTAEGGGVFNGAPSTEAVAVLNTTLDANAAAASAATSQGGNYYATASNPADFENTIVSGGNATTGPNCSPAGAGALTSQGHNLESGTDCGFTASGDRQSTDPQLGSLQDNGGPTHTQAVQPGSLVIDNGNTADCPAADQRGVTRPQGSACDIGAFEVQPPVVSTNAATSLTQTAATLNGTVTSNTLKASPASYHFEWGASTAYGNSTPSATTASGSGASTVSASLSGLTPNTTYHYRIDAINADGGSAAGADQTFTTLPVPTPPPNPTLARKPKISALSETHQVFAIAAGVTPLTAAADLTPASALTASAGKRHPRGTAFSYAVSQAATVTIRIFALKPGRQVGRKCKAPIHRLGSRPPCTRRLPTATLRRTGGAGVNSVPFTGRLPAKTLPPGRYQAVFTASNANGTSGPQTIGFTIVRR